MSRVRMSRSRFYALAISIFFSLFISSASLADGIIDFALERIGQFVDDRAEKKRQKTPDDPAYKATLPTDLPEHWRLKVFRESVFDGEVFVAESGDVHDPVLFLVHGLGQVGMRDWLPVVPVLEDRYHVVLIDLPGFASSAKPRGRYSPTNYAKVLGALKNSYSPNKPIAVVGHSMGAAVTLRYSSMYPNDVKQALLVDAAGILERTAFSKHAADYSTGSESYPDILAKLINDTQDVSGSFIEILNRLPDPTRVITNDTAWGKVFNGRTNVNAALALVEENFSSAVFDNTVNIDLIWGENDGVAPLRTGQLLKKHIDHARLKVIADAEHVPMTSHPTEFNQALLNMLAYSEDEQSVNHSGRVNNAEVDFSSASILHCKDELGGHFSGVFTKVLIEHCTDVVLEDVVSQEIEIVDSRIELMNVSVSRKGGGLFDKTKAAVSVRDSVVLATNLIIEAESGLLLTDSRLDIAGANIQVEKSAIEIQGKSRVVLSISKIKSQYYSGYAHGLYAKENNVLDNHFK